MAIICATAVLHNIGIRSNDYEDIETGGENEVVNNQIYQQHNQLGLLFRTGFINVHFQH